MFTIMLERKLLLRRNPLRTPDTPAVHAANSDRSRLRHSAQMLACTSEPNTRPPCIYQYSDLGRQPVVCCQTTCCWRCAAPARVSEEIHNDWSRHTHPATLTICLARRSHGAPRQDAVPTLPAPALVLLPLPKWRARQTRRFGPATTTRIRTGIRTGHQEISSSPI